MTKPPLILLVGPTAVGKTAIAIELAGRINAEVVSADSRLFYRGLDIGTAKPTPAERSRVPHHLIDIADPDEVISLAVFQRMARAAIEGIRSRGRWPLLVGGTGQYVRAVTEGWTPPEVEPDELLRDALLRQAQSRGPTWLHAGLRRLDLAAADRIDPRNTRRTVRALEVILKTGRRFSDLRRHAQSPYSLLTIGLRRPRPELYARIDARIAAMFDSGLLDEVRALLARGYSPDLPSLSAIGYREAVRVVTGEWTADQARAAMQRATRAFVRRQANWFKESNPEMHWFEAGAADVVAQVEGRIRRASIDF